MSWYLPKEHTRTLGRAIRRARSTQKDVHTVEIWQNIPPSVSTAHEPNRRRVREGTKQDGD